MQQAADRLKELGCKGKHVFRNLADAKAAVARVEARQAGKPSSKPVRDHHKARPINPKVDSIDDLKAAAKTERDPSKKAALLGKLSQRLLSHLGAEKDQVKVTNIRQEYQRTELQRGYALLAERTANPTNAKVRKYIDAASRD